MFYDEFALQFYDDESADEDRFLMLGLSNQSRVLVVVHCERGQGMEELRVISARKATKSERRYYQGEGS
ncbi:BrnT family toxin [Seongchinamella sediminis]|uniref:BrnT family toxin n=1 Tax=Seongchinamella sediminis TaxID=2283635 RepID=A0A3L7DVP9_9GAMM|nr:BrnT family toxin [Seongchinamella sediminis]